MFRPSPCGVSWGPLPHPGGPGCLVSPGLMEPFPCGGSPCSLGSCRDGLGMPARRPNPTPRRRRRTGSTSAPTPATSPRARASTSWSSSWTTGQRARRARRRDTQPEIPRHPPRGNFFTPSPRSASSLASRHGPSPPSPSTRRPAADPAQSAVVACGAGPCHIVGRGAGKVVLVANYGGGSVGPCRSGRTASSARRRRSSSTPGRSPHEAARAPARPLDQPRRRQPVRVRGRPRPRQGHGLKFDAAKGTLTPNDPPAAKVKPGDRAPALRLPPLVRHAYACEENTCETTAFDYDPERGSVRVIKTLSTLPEGVKVTRGTRRPRCWSIPAASSSTAPTAATTASPSSQSTGDRQAHAPSATRRPGSRCRATSTSIRRAGSCSPPTRTRTRRRVPDRPRDGPLKPTGHRRMCRGPCA